MGSIESSLMPLIDAVRETANTANLDEAASHTKLLDEINTLLLAAESPSDTIFRIGYHHWHAAAIRTALDVGLFDILVDVGDAGIEKRELSRRTGVEEVLIARIVRALVSSGFCQSGTNGTFKANDKTQIMTQTQGTSSFKIWFDLFMPTAAKMPDYLRKHNYRNPSDNHSSIFADTFGSEFWTYQSAHPATAATFNDFMKSRREGRPHWFDAYAVQERLLSDFPADSDAVLLVDVGGNRGHDLLKFKEAFKGYGDGGWGRLILQDRRDVIVAVVDELRKEGVECMAHDFFAPQPVRGARAYHLRAILHDWPDAQCRTILTHIAAAMKPGPPAIQSS